MYGIASNPIIVNNYVSQASANEFNFASSSGTLVGSDQSKFANSCFPASATNTNTNKPPVSILNSGKRSLNPPTFFSPKGTAGAPPPLGPPNHYFASQLNKNGATLTRMYPRFDDLPLTMSLSPYICDLNNGASQTDHACLIGIKLCDVFEVNNFTWKESFRKLGNFYVAGTEKAPKSSRDPNQVRPWLFQGTLTAQAEATAAKRLLSREQKQEPGIIIQKVTNKANIAIKVAAASLIQNDKLYQSQLKRVNLFQIQAGQIIWVVETKIPQEAVVGPNYILPKFFPFSTGMEHKAHEHWVAISAFKWTGAFNLEHPLSTGSSDEEIKHYLALLAAATQAAVSEEQESSRKEAVVASLISGDDDFGINIKADTDTHYIRLAKRWRDMGLVKVRKSWNEPVIATGFVNGVEENPEELRIWVSLKLEPQQKKGCDSTSVFDEIKAREGECVFQVIQPVTAMKARISKFRAGMPMTLANQNTDAGLIMRNLLGLQNSRILLEQSPQVDELPTTIADLNKKQQETARLFMSKESGVVYQFAPAGTGKTMVASVILHACLLQDPTNHFVCLAPTNTALFNLVRQVFKACEDVLGKEGEKPFILVVVSEAAKRRYSDLADQYKDFSIIKSAEEMLKQEKLPGVSGGFKRGIKRHLEREEQNLRNFPATKLERQLLTKIVPMLTFMTVAMAEEHSHLVAKATHLILDEAGQAHFNAVLSVVSDMAHLTKFLPTGDSSQLPAYTADLSDHIRPYGFQGLCEQLAKIDTVSKVQLNIGYRSHPILTELASNAIYLGLLTCGVTADQRNALTSSGFPLPTGEVPVILINILESDQKDQHGTSRFNPAQTNAACRLLKALRAYHSLDIHILAIVLYKSQLKRIGLEMGDSVELVTVDGFQGQQADITVVVTTRSPEDMQSVRVSDQTDRRHRFALDDQRAAVAITRAAHGLAIIGNMEFMEHGGVWGRFLREASTLTQVVTPEYLDYVEGIMTAK
ncbi:AAA domain-containing protein [Ditylenchus destructor]|uniref:AAA domain-containing protein n=1 Tax=Ditylenchus destructor TaxID=166010 RepID=A0AAD4NFB9_9BILA|nr:AAA domain-containing protein [Ditylenchus destructor]